MNEDLNYDQTIRSFYPGQKVFNRYKLVKQLGRGGMGIVWLAEDEKLDLKIALKFLPEVVANDDAAIDDLKRETKKALKLTHPNIVRIYDFLQDDNTVAVSMEYVDGKSLTQLRIEESQRAFTTEQIMPWLKDLCNALDYAHNKAKIAHRDLKPSNLLISSEGEIKITDFGISATIADTTTRSSMHASSSGTPVYMSPQQMMGEKASPTDDVYSLGATIYELLTGKPPFYTGNILLQTQNVIPKPMSERRVDLEVVDMPPIPQQWEATIAACLAKDAAERPQGVLDMLQMLKSEVYSSLMSDSLNEKVEEPTLKAPKRANINKPAAFLLLLIAIIAAAWGLNNLQKNSKTKDDPVEIVSKEDKTDSSSPEDVTSMNSMEDKVAEKQEIKQTDPLTELLESGFDKLLNENSTDAIIDLNNAINVVDAPPEQLTLAYAFRSIARDSQNDAEGAHQDTVSARENLDKVVTRNSISYLAGAFTSMLEGNGERCISGATQALQMGTLSEKNQYKAHMIRGASFESSDQLLNDIADYSQVVKLENIPTKWKLLGYESLATNWKALNNTDKLIETYTQALFLEGLTNDQREEILTERAYLFSEINNYEKAITDYSELLNLPNLKKSSKAIILYKKALYEFILEKFDAALIDFHLVTLIEEIPVDDKANAYYWLGNTHKFQGDISSAIESLEAGISLDGISQEKEKELKLLLSELKRPEKGVNWSIPDAKIDMIWIEPGSFIMGSPESEKGRYSSELAHRVTLTDGYWLGKHEVTQGQWNDIMGGTIRDQVIKGVEDDTEYTLGGKKQTLRSYWGLNKGEDPIGRIAITDDNYPMYYINWDDAKEFCKRLTEIERKAGRLPQGYVYDLPTEAQWEYACRAGTTGETYIGNITLLGLNNAPKLDSIAWYKGNSNHEYDGRGWNTSDWEDTQYPGERAGPRRIGLKKPNKWELYDMLGNLLEWCEDNFDEYSSFPVTNPLSYDGIKKVARGAGWDCTASVFRSACRFHIEKGLRINDTGLRIALRPEMN